MQEANSSIEDCQLFELDRITSNAGNLTVLENNFNAPFPIKRVYYLYDIPGGAERGGHAHYELEQLVVAASGSFEVLLDDGANQKKVFLNRPYQGLLIKKMIWRELINFSSGAICLVLASDIYNEEDYIRDYTVYRNQTEYGLNDS